MECTHVTGSCTEGIELFIDEDVACLHIIIAYSGEQSTVAIRDAREKELIRRGMTNDYMLMIRAPNDVIDAIDGKSARYCNHSCDPNYEYSIVSLYFDKIVDTLVTTKQNIKSGSVLPVNSDCGEDDVTPTIVFECGAATCSGHVGVNN